MNNEKIKKIFKVIKNKLKLLFICFPRTQQDLSKIPEDIQQDLQENFPELSNLIEQEQIQISETP